MSSLNFLDRIMVKAELFEGMMRTLDVKDALADMPSAPAVLRNATIRCLTCGHVEECVSFLETHESAAHAPSFCRNRELFEFVSAEA